MRQYNVWQLTHVISMMSEWEYLSQANQLRRLGDSQVSSERAALYKPTLDYARQQCSAIELYASIARVDKFSVELRNGISWTEFGTQAKILRETIQDELRTRRFAFVSVAKASVWDNIVKSWEAVWAKLPAAKEDSERAVDCFALDQPTACVFHAMRVAEFGLRRLATKLKVKLTHKGKTSPIDFTDWNTVITASKNKISQARSLPAGPKRQAQLEFYADAADHCLYMKDIWRNNVAHTRKPYDEREALAALDRVREFVNFLALHI